MLSTCIQHLKSQPLCILILSSFGFLSLYKHTFSLLKLVFITFLRPPKNLKENYGSCALITGSTDGIGKAFAFQLAQKGLNLILVSRNSQKLRSVSSEIQAQYPHTKIKVVVLDFSDITAGIRVVEEAVEGVEVGVLVNNVGVSYPTARFFHEVEEEVWRRVVRVNLEGTTRVTRAVLKGMIERKRGAIVNVGSGAAIVVPSHPLYAVYAATKAYIELFSRCISLEYKQHGIDVQCQIPLLVATKMASIKRSSFFIPSPETYSKASLRAIGYEQISIPYWPHSLQCILIRALPDVVQDYCLLRYFLGMRKRGLKKQQQEQHQKK
ncbi:hypothetical protein ACSBR2_036326 [Camellia fascicularis]